MEPWQVYYSQGRNIRHSSFTVNTWWLMRHKKANLNGQIKHTYENSNRIRRWDHKMPRTKEFKCFFFLFCIYFIFSLCFSVERSCADKSQTNRQYWNSQLNKKKKQRKICAFQQMLWFFLFFFRIFFFSLFYERRHMNTHSNWYWEENYIKKKKKRESNNKLMFGVCFFFVLLWHSGEMKCCCRSWKCNHLKELIKECVCICIRTSFFFSFVFKKYFSFHKCVTCGSCAAYFVVVLVSSSLFSFDRIWCEISVS